MNRAQRRHQRGRFIPRPAGVELPAWARAAVSHLDRDRSDDAVSQAEFEERALAMFDRVERELTRRQAMAFAGEVADIMLRNGLGLPVRFRGWLDIGDGQ